jgi:hypothetical protein
MNPQPTALTEAQLKEAADKIAAARLANTAYTNDLIAWEAKRDARAFDLHSKDITKPYSDSLDAASAELASSKPVAPGSPAPAAPAKAATPAAPSVPSTPSAPPPSTPVPAKAS